MKIAPVSGDLIVKLALFGAAGLGALYLLQRVRASMPDFSGANWQALNPLSDQNLAYQGANSVVSALTGRDETLGGWAYEYSHPAGGGTNIYDPENVFNPALYNGLNSAVGAAATDPAGPGMNADGSWSLGGWIYDVTH